MDKIAEFNEILEVKEAIENIKKAIEENEIQFSTTNSYSTQLREILSMKEKVNELVNTMNEKINEIIVEFELKYVEDYFFLSNKA